MLAVIQSVLDASVSVDGVSVGAIDRGMLVYFGLEKDDSEDMLEAFLDKMLRLRIFKDENGKMNLSLSQSGGSMLFVSQFTLACNLYSGNRPGFDSAMPSAQAEEIYNRAVLILRERGYHVECGRFGAHMLVRYTNDGPETFMLDSRRMKGHFPR